MEKDTKVPKSKFLNQASFFNSTAPDSLIPINLRDKDMLPPNYHKGALGCSSDSSVILFGSILPISCDVTTPLPHIKSRESMYRRKFLKILKIHSKSF